MAAVMPGGLVHGVAARATRTGSGLAATFPETSGPAAECLVDMVPS